MSEGLHFELDRVKAQTLARQEWPQHEVRISVDGEVRVREPGSLVWTIVGWCKPHSSRYGQDSADRREVRRRLHAQGFAQVYISRDGFVRTAVLRRGLRGQGWKSQGTIAEVLARLRSET